MQAIPSMTITEATTSAINRDALYFGCVIKAGAGGAVGNIRAGSATGTLLDSFSLGANAPYVSAVPNENGLRASGGVYVEVISGTFTGAVRAV